jgi:hypothetical protein
MNTNLPEPASRRNALLPQWTAARRDGLTPTNVPPASRLRRWLSAVLQALTPAPIPTGAEAPADMPPQQAHPATFDSRALPPWRPFSPRF